jgi:2-polyprenyl-3-methyl-5-hydroxy-6-metoxy-1,4-benzoquinol methylase
MAAPMKGTATPPVMKQTPAHRVVNRDLHALMPLGARHVVEVGCMQGALAKVYRAANPTSRYTGIDIDPLYAREAAAHCTRTLGADIEALDAAEFGTLFPSDCWVFGDCLEHLRDPWRIVRWIRERIDPSGCLVACIPNAQHWSVQMRLATGAFRYEDSGLLDRTHLRWLTRITIQEMFVEAGWRIERGIARKLPTPAPPALLAGIRAVAEAAGADGNQAVADAAVFQYLFRVVPG